MDVNDPELRSRLERTFLLIPDEPEDEKMVIGLMDAYDWFRLAEGEGSPRVREAIEHLLSPELRPALRGWYRKWGNGMNPAAIEFRERLSKMAGEEFG
jgi:hypothetical protein